MQVWIKTVDDDTIATTVEVMTGFTVPEETAITMAKMREYDWSVERILSETMSQAEEAMQALFEKQLNAVVREIPEVGK